MIGTRTERLSNGIPVLLKHSEVAQSISIGIFVKAGLVQEPLDCNGMAHFLEHMSFKGTHKRRAKRITEEVDHIGGVINAHTTKEYTCYYISVLPHFFKKATDILSDLYLNSVLNESDIQMEKQVVLEEIHMYDDTPDENIHDQFSSAIWQESPLGRPILGDKASLARIQKPAVENFKLHYLQPQNISIVVAGKIIEPKPILRMINKAFGPLRSSGPSFSELSVCPTPFPCVDLSAKQTEQVHFCLGLPGIPYKHHDRYKVTLLATLLGGSMSSRLFQKIREKRGWAYSIFAYTSFYDLSGLFTIYAGINQKRFLQTLRIIKKECEQLQDFPVKEKELRKIKAQLKGNLILGLEKSTSWMHWLGRSWLYFDRILEVEEVIQKIEAVSANDLVQTAQNLFRPEAFTVAAVGPFSKRIVDLKSMSVARFMDQKNDDLF